MYAKIKPWIVRNQHRISWFIVGMMTMSTVHYLAKGDLMNAGLCVFIAVANIIMDQQEMV
jgi:uncharacterized membrane protein (DUF4010 family)